MQPQNGDQSPHPNTAVPQHMPISQIKEQLMQQSANNNAAAPQPPAQPQPASQPQAQPPANVIQPTTAVPGDSAAQANATPQAPASATAAPSTESQAPSSAIVPEVNATDMFMRSLVGLQIASLVIIVIGFFPAPLFFSTWPMVVGALMVGLGIFLGVWSVTSFRQKITPNPKPLKHSFLVTGGPYKYMRHPMYAALLLASIGLTLVYPTITRIIALLVLTLVLISKMNIEEYLLAKRYSHYVRYQRITGKIIPKFKKPDIDIDIPKFEG